MFHLKVADLNLCAAGRPLLSRTLANPLPHTDAQACMKGAVLFHRE